MPDSAGTSGAVLLLAAAAVSAGTLLSAFAGAAGASVIVSLPIAAVSASVFAVLELAGLALLPDFSVLLSVTGALSGWRTGGRRGLGRHGPGSGLSVFRGW